MSTIIHSAGRYIRLALGKGQIANDAQRRHVGILRGMSTGLVGKGISIIVSFISVPLTLRYLGPERYGVWVTISTAMMWITLADFGMSNSLTNAISEAYGKDRRDLAQSYVASAFWLLAAGVVLFGVIFFPIWHLVTWDRVLNVQTAQARAEAAPAVAIAFVIFALNFPFTSISKIYGAYQEVAIANAWAATGNLLSLGALIAVTQLKGGLVWLILAVSGAVLFVNVISAVWVFWWSKPWLLPRLTSITQHAVKKLSGIGGMFFVVQLAGLVLFQTDNLIIAHFLGAKAVTPYSVTWRLFTYTTLFQILAGPSYWPAYAEAFSRSDRAWVRRTFRMNLTATVGSTLVLGLPLVLFGQVFIEKWAGKEAVPTFSLLLWMGVWSVISAAMNSQACILASSGRLRGQMFYSVAAAAVNLALSIMLVQKIGLTGVIIGTVVAYLTCVIVPQWREVEHAIRD
jgi:O-antigen/teichoic acid export membrane protein